MENIDSKKIFKHLWDQMKALESKSITIEEAKAQAALSKQANNLLKHQLDKAVAKAKFENLVIENDIEK